MQNKHIEWLRRNGYSKSQKDDEFLRVVEAHLRNKRPLWLARLLASETVFTDKKIWLI